MKRSLPERGGDRLPKRHRPSPLDTRSLEDVENSARAGNGDDCHFCAALYVKMGNYQLGFQYYAMAINNNHRRTLFDIGVFYNDGIHGLKKDSDAAARHWLRAAQLGHHKSKFNYARMIYNGEIEGNQELALQYFKDCADKGFDRAEYMLGSLYHEGKWVPKDLTIAFEYTLKAAQKKDILSMNRLASMYFFGWGTEMDKAKAAQLYKEIADKEGNAVACYNYGTQLLTGDGVEKDLKEAVRYMLISVEQNYPSAAHALGLLYSKGEAVEQNIAEAVRFYKIAASQEHEKSMFQLAKLHETGNGVEYSLVEALRLYKRINAKGINILSHAVPHLAAKICAESNYCS